MCLRHKAASDPQPQSGCKRAPVHEFRPPLVRAGWGSRIGLRMATALWQRSGPESRALKRPFQGPRAGLWMGPVGGIAGAPCRAPLVAALAVALPSLGSPIREALDEAFGDESCNQLGFAALSERSFASTTFEAQKTQVGYGT